MAASTSATSSSGAQRCCMHSALQLPHDWLVACRARAFSHACTFASEWCSRLSVTVAFFDIQEAHAVAVVVAAAVAVVAGAAVVVAVAVAREYVGADIPPRN